jgi:ABC-type nickel/cobalt efflux system permease component RcnA
LEAYVKAETKQYKIQNSNYILHCNNKMKDEQKKKYHTVGTVPECNGESVETHTHTHTHTHTRARTHARTHAPPLTQYDYNSTMYCFVSALTYDSNITIYCFVSALTYMIPIVHFIVSFQF